MVVKILPRILHAPALRLLPLACLALIVTACGNATVNAPPTTPSPKDDAQGTLTIAPDDARAGVPSGLAFTLDIPQGAGYPSMVAIDAPKGWNLSGWRVPAGVAVGKIVADLKIGVANRDCTIPVHAEFLLLTAAAGGPTVSTTEATLHPPTADVFEDRDGNHIPDGADRLPDFLTALDLPGAPFARAYGQSLVSSFPVFVDLVTRDLGGGELRSYFMMGDPAYKSPVVTSMCTPLKATLTLFGASGDGPLLKNPAQSGSYTWLFTLTSSNGTTSTPTTTTGEAKELSSPLTISSPPASGAEVVARPPDPALLPPVWDPEDRNPRTPNPSGPILNPDEAPKQRTGDARSLGRSDCAADALAVVSQDGWSVCHSATWEFHSERRWEAGIWEDAFSLYRRSDGKSVGAIAIHNQVVSRTGAVLPICSSPEPAELAGYPAQVCRWDEPRKQAPTSETAAVAYYVPFADGRITLEGASYSDDPAVFADIEAIFASLRLP